jgi:cytochrome c oxidase subunit 2
VSKKTRGRATLALVAALAVAGLAAAARADDPLHLMPESASAEADKIDGLTYLILWITGVTFFAVEILLVVFLVKYRARDGQKAKYTHGNHAVELVWTVTPALILVFLALYQMKLWLQLKAKTPEDNVNPTQIQVFAKQFEWNFRYPGPDGKFGTADDLLTVSACVVPVGHPVNATLRSMDVIHSFYLPNFRFKQDAVPGLTIPFWFRPTKLSADRQPVPNRDGVPQNVKYWDIVCAELCGIGHTTMGAQLWVVSDEDYAKWLKDPASVPYLAAANVTWAKWNKDNPVTTPDQIWSHWELQDLERRIDDQGRLVMHAAKLNREPFGEDEKPAASGSKTEDF